MLFRSQGIFGHDGENGAYYISPADAPSSLKIAAIREYGTRAEFYGPRVSSNIMTFEQVLDLARENKEDVPGSKAAREKAAAARAAEDLKTGSSPVPTSRPRRPRK